ncbi:hypothetical protein PWT90_09914 [Aphanocladium album]|nr:hypothetical protein PWT90_09914 [Aphanocladium album]
MLAKTALALPLAASLIEQASAWSLHRHQHAVDKRAIHYETIFETVYVTATAEADASPAETPAAFVQDSQPAPPAPAPPAPTTLATAVKQLALPSLPIIGNILPTKSSSSASPSNTGLPFGSKQGLAYNDASMANIFKKSCSKEGVWAYNWGSSPSGLDSDIPYVPLLWGDIPVHTDHWHNDAEAALSKGAKALLSFNEPDMPSQANMAPGAAAAAHAKYFSSYVGRAQIGSPAVSNSGQKDQGLDWLKQWVTACNADSNCHFDFCTVHWYSEAQYADTLFKHLKDANDICQGKPVWLTEFAPFGSDDQISGFLKSVLPKLDSLDYLHAYSYFMVAQNQLMSSNTALSTIGNVYASL